MTPNPLSVLLIEGDLPTAELYTQVLKQEYEVLVCENEDQIFHTIKNRNINAVILEPAMLGGRGWSILAQIQNELVLHPIPIILCSSIDDRKKGIQLGASAYLVKPVLPHTLLGALNRILVS